MENAPTWPSRIGVLYSSPISPAGRQISDGDMTLHAEQTDSHIDCNSTVQLPTAVWCLHSGQDNEGQLLLMKCYNRDGTMGSMFCISLEILLV